MRFETSILVIVMMVLLGATISHADRLCGLERMDRVDRLPELLEGTKVLQVSSRDRLGGNAGDGYYGTHPCLYTDANGEKVLFDERTSGCLYRFWMTFTSSSVLTNRLRFYFDGEESPSLDTTVGEFFSGTNAPFLAPLVGNGAVSCKGYYSYYPFEYETGLKVTISSVPTGTGTQASPFYYNMTYHQFDSVEGVLTWDGSESVVSVVDKLSRIGSDPKSTNGNIRVSAVLNLADGESGSLLDIVGVGAVQSIKLDPSPSTVAILRDCRLVMNWDGGVPEVDVPMGGFFGSGKSEMEIASLPIGMSTCGDYYCFFSMPYWQSAEINIINDSGSTVQIPFEIQYSTNAYEQLRCGYFHAEHKDQFIGNDGQDVGFITTQGRGHFVGLSLYILGLDYTGNNLDHLEGDERIYFDGSLSPAIYGTGTEDYFNCAWYFNGAPCLLPYHGVGLQEFNPSPPNVTQTYRFHLSDVLPFYSNFRFGMEHGRANNTSGIYSSVAYFYKQQDPGWEQTVVFDVLDADAISYQATGGSIVSNSWCFEGDDDQVFVSATGVSFSVSSEFRVPVTINSGVVLRRLTDRGIGRQKALVYVDDVFVGTWYDADCNFVTARVYNTESYVDVMQRWNESEFLIPLELTAGKTNLHIVIERDVDGADSWNEYRYEVFCVKPLDHPDDVDADGLPDRWEVDYFNNVGAAVPDVDVDEDGLDTHDEYIAGTSPVDPYSVFEIDKADGEFEFFTQCGRSYIVWFTTNLVEGAWQAITNFQGSDTEYMMQPDASKGFYRAEVWKND